MLDFYQNSFKAYLVLERAGDITLEKFVKITKTQISLGEIKIIGRQLLEAVAFLHANGISHRDIKPDNIMLVTAPELLLKLIDFNVAHDLSQNPEIKGA